MFDKKTRNIYVLSVNKQESMKHISEAYTNLVLSPLRHLGLWALNILFNPQSVFIIVFE